MKKLLLVFLFITGFLFGQQKTLYKAISYNDIIELYNQKLGLKNESLSANIDRCKFIVADAKKKDDYNTEIAFGLFLVGLQEAEKKEDKTTAFISIYKEPTRYSFYDYKDRFVGSESPEKMEEDVEINGNKTETYVQQFFYLMQE